jgi:hypothetical protein
MTREEVAEYNEEALLLPKKYDSAIIGIAERINLGPVAAYDVNKLIELLAEEMEPDADDIETHGDVESAKQFLALEYFDFNIKGGWLGEGTPVFITKSLD